MDNERLYLSPPFITDGEISAVTDILKDGWVAPVGRGLDTFEAALEKRFNFPKVLCTQSGTAALHLAVKLAGVTRGDKVLIGTFTFVAAANAVLYEGGIPLFIDSDRDSWNLDPALLAHYLDKMDRAGDLPKAVILTHIFGRPARAADIKSVCQQYGVKLIDDAAEAVGSAYEDVYAGNWGDYGVLSFNGNKVLTTGGGGGLICQQEEDYERAKYWATQSRENMKGYTHREIGYNYRMSNVLAGLGLAQLKQIDHLLGRKRIIYKYYRAHLPEEVFEFSGDIEGGRSNHWLSTVLIRKEQLNRVTPDMLKASLEKENIEARRFWKPLHCQPLFENSVYIGAERVAEDFFHRGICLPCGVGITMDDQQRVISSIISHLTN